MDWNNEPLDCCTVGIFTHRTVIYQVHSTIQRFNQPGSISVLWPGLELINLAVKMLWRLLLQKRLLYCILTILWKVWTWDHTQHTYVLYIHDWMNLYDGYSHTFFPLAGLCYGMAGTYTFKIPHKSNSLTVCAEPCGKICWTGVT